MRARAPLSSRPRASRSIGASRFSSVTPMRLIGLTRAAGVVAVVKQRAEHWSRLGSGQTQSMVSKLPAAHIKSMMREATILRHLARGNCGSPPDVTKISHRSPRGEHTSSRRELTQSVHLLALSAC